MSVEFESLTADDRTAILAEYDRTIPLATGVNTTSPGCVMFILAVVLFVSVPSLLRKISSASLAHWLFIAFIAVEVFVVLLGLYWYFRSSGGAYGRTVVRSREAIATITTTYPAGQALECGKAVARLVASAYYSDGPSTSSTFKVEEARQQIGSATQFVTSVERFLLSERKIQPVFTLDRPW